ncbi:MAG: hypothetical protein OJF49_003947 [Ktedonobacterales bacterium]|nr:MAG: hypothetical protein OJF49_003947 [Ktedonobacterales bacterium]
MLSATLAVALASGVSLPGLVASHTSVQTVHAQHLRADGGSGPLFPCGGGVPLFC